MKKCMDYEAEDVMLRGRPKKACCEVTKKVARPDQFARKMPWTVGNGGN